MACSGGLVLVTRSVYGVISYSRHTCPPALGSVPLPLVTLAIVPRGALAAGCRLPGAAAGALAGLAPGARQFDPPSGGGACASASATQLITRHAAKINVLARPVIWRLLAED